MKESRHGALSFAPREVGLLELLTRGRGGVKLEGVGEFPAQHDDALATYKWAVANAASLNADPVAARLLMLRCPRA